MRSRLRPHKTAPALLRGCLKARKEAAEEIESNFAPDEPIQDTSGQSNCEETVLGRIQRGRWSPVKLTVRFKAIGAGYFRTQKKPSYALNGITQYFASSNKRARRGGARAASSLALYASNSWHVANPSNSRSKFSGLCADVAHRRRRACPGDTAG